MNLKKYVVVAIAVVVIGFVLFQSSRKDNIQINNERCPVTGQYVNDRDVYVYKGKEYRLCSDACKQRLSQNPEKYLND